MIKVALLECKSGAIAAKSGFLALSFFAHSAHQSPNPLCLKPFIPARSKLKNFAPKILLCAERVVLSIRNANIVFGGTSEELGFLNFELGIILGFACDFELI